MNYSDYIRTIPDFPRKGILFRDITTLVGDGDAFRSAVNLFVERYRGKGISKIVGIEARGFIFGSAIAYALGNGFIPIRKKGKLPAETIEESYELEYGTDYMEIHKDAISPGERVVLFDDLIATGGTLRAAMNLIERLGGRIHEISCLIELTPLAGREKIPNIPFFSVIKYNVD